MSNSKTQMPNEIQSSNDKKYNLEERTATFGEHIIEFAKSLHQNAVTASLISQFVRAGTSIGANYMEADGAESRSDFRHKIALCKKESKETRHWIRMIAKACPESIVECRKLWQEADELTLIFSSILRSKKSEKI